MAYAFELQRCHFIDSMWRLMRNRLLPALLLCIGFCTLSGCSRSPSASRGYDHLVAAAEAISAGDKELALSELSASIEASPSAWAYFERARLHLENGQEADAAADCQKGLELDPEYRDLLWLSAELKKPAAQRFQGRFARSPGPP